MNGIPEFVLLAASSFGLGALHALEPGHGKTVVGAYLVGSKGTSWDAVLLGFVVTLTHTGIVILLGIMSTVAAAYFVPATVQQVLEVVSGFLIVIVGGWMIGVRVRQARGHRRHGHDHGVDDHDHDHGGHGHAHDHSHETALKPGERAGFGQLVALGVSGGIVPCPAALAVLLAAISIGGFARGVSLVIVFSLGMATTLVVIGLAMVHAARFAGRYVAESRWTKIVPIINATIITVIGIGLTAHAIWKIM
jgi:nickel/cobalt transporter (NicO) family protein